MTPADWQAIGVSGVIAANTVQFARLIAKWLLDHGKQAQKADDGTAALDARLAHILEAHGDHEQRDTVEFAALRGLIERANAHMSKASSDITAQAGSMQLEQRGLATELRAFMHNYEKATEREAVDRAEERRRVDREMASIWREIGRRRNDHEETA